VHKEAGLYLFYNYNYNYNYNYRKSGNQIIKHLYTQRTLLH